MTAPLVVTALGNALVDVWNELGLPLGEQVTERDHPSLTVAAGG